MKGINLVGIKLLAIAMLCALTLLAPLAHAGRYADTLSECLVQLSTDDDKLKLVTWMFTAMSLHPAVAQVAQVSTAARDTANKDMAELLVDLLEQRCFDQAKAAIENEGPLALQTSFAVLGQVAATELFSNPAVAAGLANLDEFLDTDELEKRLGIGQ